MSERSATAQLLTARVLLAQFDAQLDEYAAMNRGTRRGTARGQDLTRRLTGLREGRAKWAARVRELEPLAEAEKETS